MNAYILFFNGSTDLNIFYTYLDIIRDTQSKISVKEMKSCQQHSVHWGINPPSKTPPSLSCQLPLLNLQTVQAPLFRQSPLYIGFS